MKRKTIYRRMADYRERRIDISFRQPLANVIRRAWLAGYRAAKRERVK